MRRGPPSLQPPASTTGWASRPLSQLAASDSAAGEAGQELCNRQWKNDIELLYRQFSTAQNSTVQYIQYSTVQNSTVQNRTEQNSALQHSTEQRGIAAQKQVLYRTPREANQKNVRLLWLLPAETTPCDDTSPRNSA